MKKADVVLNVYGKPFQTAVALLSLLKHSGDLIDKIYFIEEPKQPKGTDFRFLFDLLKDRIIRFRPRHWLWVNQTDRDKLSDESYRLSVRYQYAWEKSDKDFLFITHNDVLYTGNIIQTLLDHLSDHIGIGMVGQCWNCPASAAKLCDGSRYYSFRPGTTELMELLEKYKARLPRKFDENMSYEKVLSRNASWPLPECRLNEWVALVNLETARKVTVPYGEAMPFGAYYGLDLGTQWFYDVGRMGYKVKHYDFTSIAHHGWTSGISNGHSALFDKQLYQDSESVARSMLINDFGISPELLTPRRSFSIKRLFQSFKRRNR